MTREEFLRQEIDKYRRKIETYQAMISEWEVELGIPAASNPQSQPLDASGHKKSPGAADPLSLVHGMIFFNKSQSEAAKAFLEMVGYPLKTWLILEAVEKGGLKVGGKTAVAKKQNFYTILHRSPDFGLVTKDTWGLVDWPGVTKKAADEVAEPESAKKDGSNDEAVGK